MNEPQVGWRDVHDKHACAAECRSCACALSFQESSCMCFYPFQLQLPNGSASRQVQPCSRAVLVADIAFWILNVLTWSSTDLPRDKHGGRSVVAIGAGRHRKRTLCRRAPRADRLRCQILRPLAVCAATSVLAVAKSSLWAPPSNPTFAPLVPSSVHGSSEFIFPCRLGSVFTTS